MAFPVKRIATGDERALMVEVKVAAMFRHDGAYVRPRDHIMVTMQEAADLTALGFVKPLHKDPLDPPANRGTPARGSGRGYVREKKL
jgi:hypothetical protein